MNRKQFLILLALVVAIGAAGLFVHQHKKHLLATAAAPPSAQKLLPNLAVNDVAQITIKSGTDDVTLARQDNLWRVQ